MADLIKSKKEEFHEEYPYELVKDNPFLMQEAIGWLRGTQACVPSISEWSNQQEQFLKLQVLNIITNRR